VKIVHLANTPLSNAPANLARCQALYGGHETTLYLYKKAALTRVHSAGTQWGLESADKVRETISKADVIHFHNYAFEQKIFGAYPDLIDVVKTKPFVVQYHSDRGSYESFEHTLKDPTIRKAIIAQYHVRLYPECEFIVPNVLPIFEKEYTPIQAKYEDATLLISYSPSNVNCKGWDDKGWLITKPIIDRIERSRAAIGQILTAVPYEECMLQKRWAHIGIDEVVTGSYHLSSLEYASMGAIPVAKLDNQTIAAMKTVVGEEGIISLPWMVATTNSLEAQLLEKVREGRAAVFEQGKKARRWMETFWNPKNHVKIFDRMYESL
jgi:hypothetical protein